MKFKQISVLIGALLMSGVTFTNAANWNARGFASKLTTARWQWLEDTYWYVPPENLQAIQWDTQSPTDYTSVDDQTVWHIERFDNGYFFGPLVVKFAGYPRLCQYMIGSITPGGRVYISFNAVQTIPLGSPSITTGTGDMVKQRRAWTFNMQMASGSSSTQVAHWAFMRQCTPDQQCWNDLPGLERSIPELLAQCDHS